MPSFTKSGSDYLVGVSCVTISTCWTTSSFGSVFKTTDAGRSWTEESLGAQYTQIPALFCLDLNHCWAAVVSSPDAIIRTTDGGSTWTRSSLPPEGSSVLDIACPTVTECWASGSVEIPTSASHGELVLVPTIFASSDGGSNWSVAQTYEAASGGLLSGMSCGSASRCTAVGATGNNAPMWVATEDAGANWTAETLPARIEQLRSVSCLASGCWADGFEGPGTGTLNYVVVYAGWNVPAATISYTTTTALLNRLDCQSSGQCWVSGSVQNGPSGLVIAYGPT